MTEEEDLLIQLQKQRKEAESIVSKGQPQGRYGISPLQTRQQQQQYAQAKSALGQIQQLQFQIQNPQYQQQQAIQQNVEKYDALVQSKRDELKSMEVSYQEKVDYLQKQADYYRSKGDSTMAAKTEEKIYDASREYDRAKRDKRSEISKYERNRSKIVEGYSISSISSSIESKIQQKEKIREINAQIKAGTYKPLEQIKQQIGYKPYYAPITNVTQLQQAIKNYNKEIAIQQNQLAFTRTIQQQISQKEYDRLQKVMPKVGWYNETTGEVVNRENFYTSEDQPLQVGFRKVYINPKTNKPIEDVNAYIAENKIPVQAPEDISQLSSAAQLAQAINLEARPSDLKELQQEKIEQAKKIPVTSLNILKGILPDKEQLSTFISELKKGSYEIFTTKGREEYRQRESKEIDKMLSEFEKNATYVQEKYYKSYDTSGFTEKYLVESALRNPEIQTTTATTAVALSFLTPLSFSTKLAVAFNYPEIKKLITPIDKVTPEDKILSLTQLGIDFGVSAASGLIGGVLFKGAELGLKTTGYSILKNLISIKTDSDLAKLGIQAAGQTILASGKLAKFGSDVYFKSMLLEGGLNIAQLTKEQQYKSAIEETDKLVGSAVGFIVGGEVATYGFKKGFQILGKYKAVTEEKPTIKTEPSNIQIEKITEPNSEIYIYRSGLIPAGGKLRPQFDIFEPSDIKNPTQQIFFRTSETRGVFGEEIQPSLSKPTFTKSPGFIEAYKFNIEKYENLGKYRYIKAFAELPIIKALIVDKIPTKEVESSLREKIIKESSTGEAKLSELNQKEILSQDTLLSDKLREREFSKEQEISLRETFILEKPQLLFGFTESGELVPIISKKGVIKPTISSFEESRIQVQQDAAYIKRNLLQQNKFLDEAVQPPAHSYPHAKSVKGYVEQIIEIYPEFKDYFIKRYGSLDISKKELGKGALAHDLGKTQSSSIEFGKEHGEKVFDVYEGKGQGKAEINLLADYGGISDPFAPRFTFTKEISIDKSLLPIDLRREVAIAIKTHQTLDVQSLGYRLRDIFGLISPEQKILATADRLDLGREGVNRIVDIERLPLKDVMNRLKKENTNFIQKNLEIRKIKEGTIELQKEAERIRYERIRIEKIKDYVSRLIGEKYYIKTTTKFDNYIYNKNINYPVIYSDYPNYKKYENYSYKTEYKLDYFPTYPKIDIYEYPEKYIKPYAGKIPYVTSYPDIPIKPLKIKDFNTNEEFKSQQELSTSQQGFNVYVKEVKGKTYKKVNTTPLTKTDASDEMAYLLDNSTARSGFIKPTVQKPIRKALPIPASYFEATRDKFRDFKVKQGKKVSFPGIIEKSGYAIDTPGEKQQLSAFRLATKINKNTPTYKAKTKNDIVDYAMNL